MKQQIKWLIAALALSALATPAFAVTADMTGSLSVRAIANNNVNDADDDNDDHAQFADQRFRLFTSVAANENVKAVLGLEVDNVWGRTAAGKQIGAMGADAKGEIEIKHLYLDFNITELSTNVKAGTQAFNLGRGLIINDDAAGIQTSTVLSPESTLSLYWIKTSEADIITGGVDNSDSNDGDFYGAKFALKSGDMTIAPYVGYYTTGPDTLTAANLEATFVGVDLDGKAGAITYGVTGLYNRWNDAGPADGTGYAIIAKAALAASDATTRSLEVARYGDGENGGQLMSLTQGAATGPNNNFSEILTGGLYTTNSSLNANFGGAATGYTTNFRYIKLGAVQTLSPIAKVSAYVMHIEQAADVNGADAITYGQELDAYFDYEIVKGLGLNLAGAYLLADSDVGEDDAWKLASSLNYKF
jgi:hypothetical protein